MLLASRHGGLVRGGRRHCRKEGHAQGSGHPAPEGRVWGREAPALAAGSFGEEEFVKLY